MGNRLRGTAAIIVVLVIILAAFSSLLIFRKIDNAGADLGLISIMIDGRYANLTAEMELTPKIDPDDVDLRLEIENRTLPISYDGDIISTSLNEDDFRSLLERDMIRIKGRVKAPVGGPILIERGISEDVNITFIREIASSLNVSDVKVTFTFTGNSIIDFKLDADVERDFYLSVNDTPARLSSPAGVFNCRILELDFRTGDGGNATVSIPALGILGLALYSRNVLIETWGLSVTASIPLFSG